MDISKLKSNKVVCINDDFSAKGNDAQLDSFIHNFQELPNKGQIYTIRLIIDFGVEKAFLLEEIRNPIIKEGAFEGIEPNFNVKRFKPLVEEEVSIEETEEIEN